MDTASLPADDAAIVDPDHHIVLFENEAVRVFRTQIGRGERTPLHSHSWPASLYVVSWSDVVIYEPDGRVRVDSRAMSRKPPVGMSLWTPPVPSHWAENVGQGDLVIIATELKLSPSAQTSS